MDGKNLACQNAVVTKAETKCYIFLMQYSHRWLILKKIHMLLIGNFEMNVCENSPNN